MDLVTYLLKTIVSCDRWTDRQTDRQTNRNTI